MTDRSDQPMEAATVNQRSTNTIGEEQPSSHAAPSPVERILLPIRPGAQHQSTLLVASVLSTWFEASLQLVVGTDDELEAARSLAQGLGLPVEEPVAADGLLGDDLVAHAHHCRPSLVVAAADADGFDYAWRATQPVLLVTGDGKNRAPTGPLVVELTGASDDNDALAVGATYATALDEALHLVATVDMESNQIPDAMFDSLSAHFRRLHQMGCDTAVDAVRPHGQIPLELIGRSRHALAAVIPTSRLADEDLVNATTNSGVNLLVAPNTGAPSAPNPAGGSVDADPGRHLLRSPLGEMSDQECIDVLSDHTVARLGYVDNGWPTVVPINYRMVDDAIYIRTLIGGKLRAAQRGDIVCLELDGVDETLREGWSVVVHGPLEVIADPAVLSEAWANDPMPWVDAGQWRWLRLTPFQVGGRRVESC
jgi:hypothetical protein